MHPKQRKALVEAIDVAIFIGHAINNTQSRVPEDCLQALYKAAKAIEQRPHNRPGSVEVKRLKHL